jgi:hypothetical protein
MPHLRLTGATPEVDTLCAVASALEGDDASDKYRAHARRDLQMLSPLATREVTGSLGRQLWMKQKDAMIAKVRAADLTLVSLQRNAVTSQEYMHLARAALTPAVPLACAPAAATGGTARRSRPTLEHIQHLAS